MPRLSRRVGERCRNRAAAEGVITRNRSGTENHTDEQLWREVADRMWLAEGDTGSATRETLRHQGQRGNAGVTASGLIHPF